MSKPDETRISYAAHCEEAAKAADRQLELHALGGRNDNDPRVPRLRTNAAALRSLAALVERAETISRATTADVDLLSSGEHTSFEEWDAIVRDLAAGYAPTDPKEGESNE